MIVAAVLATLLLLPVLARRLRRIRSRPITDPHVIDGDTIVADGRRIRLWGIDAPELAQSGGAQAKAHLRRLLAGETAMVTARGTDCYGRLIADVRLPSRGNLDVAQHLIACGFALPDRAAPRRYHSLLRKAQRRRAGLWAEGGIASPRRFRAAADSR